jgi:hypothetical protein
MISADDITDKGEIFGHGVYTSGPNAGDQRVFVLIRNPSVPLPANSTVGLPPHSTHLANLSALTMPARDGPGRGGVISAAVRRILLDRMR